MGQEVSPSCTSRRKRRSLFPGMQHKVQISFSLALIEMCAHLGQTTMVYGMDWWNKRGFSREKWWEVREVLVVHELTQEMYVNQWHCRTKIKFYLFWETLSDLLSVCLSCSISLSICYNLISTVKLCTPSESVSHFYRVTNPGSGCWVTSEQAWGAHKHTVDLQRHALLVILLLSLFFFEV